MHEYGLAQDLVRRAVAEAERCGAGRIAALYLKVGPDVVDLEALSFGIEAAAQGTVAEGAAVEIADYVGPGIVLESIDLMEEINVCGNPSAGAGEN